MSRKVIERIPTEKQREILSLFEDGLNAKLIATIVQLHEMQVISVISRGIVQPVALEKPTRCWGCGHVVDICPCLICESRQRGSNGKSQSNPSLLSQTRVNQQRKVAQ